MNDIPMNRFGKLRDNPVPFDEAFKKKRGNLYASDLSAALLDGVPGYLRILPTKISSSFRIQAPNMLNFGKVLVINFYTVHTHAPQQFIVTARIFWSTTAGLSYRLPFLGAHLPTLYEP